MRLCVVGRDYGFQEAAAGRPFVGPSGKLLTKAMALAGLMRDAPDILVTNVVNKRPPQDEWGRHAPGDVAEGLDKLQQTLALAKPELIVALGEHALQSVTQGDPNYKPPKKQTITETRGYVFESAYGPTLAMVHPAFILRTWHPWWATFCYDWAKAARKLRGDGVGRRGREQIIADPAITLSLPASAPIAVDIETTGTGCACKPVCIAFAWEMLPPWNGGDVGHAVAWTDTMLPFIKATLELPNPKVFHNGQFDVTILERAGCHVQAWAHDTMLLWHACEPLLAGKQSDTGSRSEKSLRFLASLLLDEPWWKNYAFESEEERLLLCARDARITLAVHAALTHRLQGGTHAEPPNEGADTATRASRTPHGTLHHHGSAQRVAEPRKADQGEARSDPLVLSAPGRDG